MEEPLGSHIFLYYSCRCCVQEPQACFYGSYSQPFNIPPSLNPHLAIRGKECCDTHSAHLMVGLRAWAEMSAGDRLIWKGLGHCRHWSLGFVLGALEDSADLSLSLSLSFFSFFPPSSPALKQDCNIRMASWAGMLGNLCCTRQAD